MRLIVAAALCFAACTGGLVAACASNQAVAGQVYGAELKACVDQAKSLAESKACRAKVDERWAVDGGVE